MLAACTNLHAPPGVEGTGRLLAGYVIVGADGQAIARAVIDGQVCPALVVDGASHPMDLRAPPAIVPARTASTETAWAKPAEFRVRVCEVPLASSAREATLAGRPLPPWHEQPRRIVVIGDSGCRLNQAGGAYQDCSDPRAWPLRAIAQAAAAEHPDLVLHVGDYHYRESPCPLQMPGCTDSPWGYGWDAWSADLFEPAAPLFAAAPWVVARGNHEECARAGQGWFRLLDVQRFDASRSCDDPANDGRGDFSDPYAVPLGDDWQLIVFDSARASNAPLDTTKPKDAATFSTYQREMGRVAELAAVPGRRSLFVSHYPVLAFAPAPGREPYGGNPALRAVMRSLDGDAYFPAGVAAAIHGHVHLFEAIDFASGHPATIVSGHGGDTLDRDLPEPLPPAASPAAGARVAALTHSSHFGYLVLERAAGGWTVYAKRSDGTLLTTCRLAGRQLQCNPRGKIDGDSGP